MEPRDVIRYRLLNYLIEAHESQLISANVAILNEIAEADWAQVRQALNDMFLAGDIVLSKDSQPYRVEVNAGWFFHTGNFQIKSTVRGRREYAQLQVALEKERAAQEAPGASKGGSPFSPGGDPRGGAGGGDVDALEARPGGASLRGGKGGRPCAPRATLGGRPPGADPPVYS